MRRLLVLLACLGLAAPAVASGTFSIPDAVARWGPSVVVPVRMQADDPADGIAGFVVSIDYDGTFAHFDGVEVGADAQTWDILAVNDNEHVNGCGREAPWRRLTVLAAIPVTNPWDCTPTIIDGEGLRVLFTVTGCDRTALELPAACEAYGGWYPNHVATCNNLTLAPQLGNLTLDDGSITRDCPTDVAPPAVDWGRVKGLYR